MNELSNGLSATRHEADSLRTEGGDLQLQLEQVEREVRGRGGEVKGGEECEMGGM